MSVGVPAPPPAVVASSLRAERWRLRLKGARTFARRFRQETGTTPHLWLTGQRILLARRMLESGDDSIDAVAERSGFATATMLRYHFAQIVGTSPSAYRRQFCGREAS